jgi:hypothetical protein
MPYFAPTKPIRDAAGLVSVDPDPRKLYADDGTTEVIGWATNNQINFFGGTTIRLVGNEFDVPFIYADNLDNLTGESFANIDLLNRKLYAPDGTAQMFTWDSPTRVLIFPDDLSNAAVFYRPADAGNSLSQAELDVDHVTNCSGDAGNNVDLKNRKLYAADNSTVILDWSTDAATARASLGAASIGLAAGLAIALG